MKEVNIFVNLPFSTPSHPMKTTHDLWDQKYERGQWDKGKCGMVEKNSSSIFQVI